MSLSRVNSDASDPEFVMYQPLYVEAFIENRAYTGQTIEEWTFLEGQDHFPVSDIYNAIPVSVAISGSAHNAFGVEMWKPDWHSHLGSAVRQVLIANGIAREQDKVGLETVVGESLDKLELHELRDAGAIYATVNGQRTIDMPQSKKAGLGCAVRTPVTHSLNKEAVLDKYVEDLCGRSVEAVVTKLNGSGNAEAMDKRLAQNGEVQQMIQAMIERDGGATKLNTFAELVRTYADPDVVAAIQQGTMSYADMAAAISESIVDEVVQSVQASLEKVEGFYKAEKRQEATASGRSIFVSSSVSSASSLIGDRTTFSTEQKMHRTIAGQALLNNEPLGGKIVIVIKKGHCKKMESYHRMRSKSESQRKHGHHHRHKDGHKHGGRYHSHHRKHHALLADDPARMESMLERSNYLRGLPPPPPPEYVEPEVADTVPPATTTVAPAAARIEGRAGLGRVMDKATYTAPVQRGRPHGNSAKDTAPAVARKTSEIAPAVIATAMTMRDEPPSMAPPTKEPTDYRRVAAKALPVLETAVEPPSLEYVRPAKVAAAYVRPITHKPAPSQTAEPPSLEIIPAQRKIASPVIEPPSLEFIPVAAVKAQKKISSAVIEPPSLEMIPAKSKAQVQRHYIEASGGGGGADGDDDVEGLPSLDTLNRLAFAQGRVK